MIRQTVHTLTFRLRITVRSCSVSAAVGGTIGGRNIVTGGAFGNAAGINTVIQNSGANVLIQNGTAVNVQFGGPGP